MDGKRVVGVEEYLLLRNTDFFVTVKKAAPAVLVVAVVVIVSKNNSIDLDSKCTIWQDEEGLSHQRSILLSSLLLLFDTAFTAR